MSLWVTYKGILERMGKLERPSAVWCRCRLVFNIGTPSLNATCLQGKHAIVIWNGGHSCTVRGSSAACPTLADDALLVDDHSRNGSWIKVYQTQRNWTKLESGTAYHMQVPHYVPGVTQA